MSTLRITLLAVLLFAGGLTARAQNADEILRKHIEAMGGAEKWSNINSIKMDGSMSGNGMEAALTRTIVNNKGMRMDIHAMGKNAYTITTAKEGWIYMPFIPGMEKVTPMPADQVRLSQRQLDVKNEYLMDKSKIGKAEFAGVDTINNKACYKIKITDPDGNVSTSYFDAKTYYIIRTEFVIKVQDQEQELAFDYSDFKKQAEGIVLPMTYGSMQGTVIFKSVEINKPVNDNIFKPEEPK